MEAMIISAFFTDDPSSSNETEISDSFMKLIDKANSSLSRCSLPPAIKCIYNPTEYARYTFEMYVKKYCNTKKHIMFFGMNPGPWGMSQTGVPFGEVSSVRDWLQISGPVGKPPIELKERPVNGFQCTRAEVSGRRFWGLLKNVCGTPENFFNSSFIYNYLNQQWMRGNGCNITPGDFKVSEMQSLYNICDPIFIDVVKLYEVKVIVAIGKFCELRAHKAIEKYLPSNTIQVYYLPHPSPRTVNNNDWDKKAMECFEKFDLLQYYTYSVQNGYNRRTPVIDMQRVKLLFG